MSKSKYYTPKIEEFHVGFEYEYNTMSECGSSTKYVKDIFKPTDNVELLFKDLPNDWYDLPRVKYLDREDIESIGGKLWQIPGDSFSFEYELDLNENMSGLVNLSKEGIVENLVINDCRFDIKNKSEYLKLLEWLGIITIYNNPPHIIKDHYEVKCLDSCTMGELKNRNK